MPSTGIKELKEVVILGFALAGIVKELAKDGLQPSDALALAEKLTAPEVVAKIQAAVEGVAALPAEAADFSLVEGLELSRYVIGEIKKLAA